MMKVLLIGLGNMGKNHLRVLKKILSSHDAKIITCDLRETADYNDYIQAIEVENPTHIVIATTTNTHEAILDYCAKKKSIKIFIEKPIVEKNATKYLGKNVFVGHIERYNPIIKVIKHKLQGKKIDSIICTRSGLLSKKETTDLDLDLCIHDFDVCSMLVNNFEDTKYGKLTKINKGNSCNMMIEINDTVCFMHADKKSSIKNREIKVIGEGFYIIGDYINQTVILNGENIPVMKQEPLLVELEKFLFAPISQTDLKDSIMNVEIINNG